MEGKGWLLPVGYISSDMQQSAIENVRNRMECVPVVHFQSGCVEFSH